MVVVERAKKKRKEVVFSLSLTLSQSPPKVDFFSFSVPETYVLFFGSGGKSFLFGRRREREQSKREQRGRFFFSLSLSPSLSLFNPSLDKFFFLSDSGKGRSISIIIMRAPRRAFVVLFAAVALASASSLVSTQCCPPQFFFEIPLSSFFFNREMVTRRLLFFFATLRKKCLGSLSFFSFLAYIHRPHTTVHCFLCILSKWSWK